MQLERELRKDRNEALQHSTAFFVVGGSSCFFYPSIIAFFFCRFKNILRTLMCMKVLAFPNLKEVLFSTILYLKLTLQFPAVTYKTLPMLTELSLLHFCCILQAGDVSEATAIVMQCVLAL